MPLTDYQRELVLLLSSNRTFDSYLAGGAAILIEPNTMRFSRDLDYFHDSEARVSKAFEADRRQLVSHGYSVDVDLSQGLRRSARRVRRRAALRQAGRSRASRRRSLRSANDIVAPSDLQRDDAEPGAADAVKLTAGLRPVTCRVNP